MSITALMPVYPRCGVRPVRGEGCYLFSEDGTRYLDFAAGIAVNALGHGHPHLVKAIADQAATLMHVSNLYGSPQGEALAQRIVDNSFADTVFFTNSGAEAVECAIKTARRYHYAKGAPERIDVIGFAGSFHGRTYGAINAAGNPSYTEGFGPRLPGYVQLTLDDAAGLAEAIARPTTAAVIVEPVQGEGGARALTGEWLTELRRLCTAHGVLLIYDEVQSGMGRTGRLFAHQWFEGAEPDIMCVAKALGGGYPVAACLATADAASGMVAGVHGTTFGGSPLAMAVALAAFDEISNPDTLAHARDVAEALRGQLIDLAGRYPDVIQDVRGKGLLIGLRMIPNNREFMGIARDHGLLVAGGGENCVRLLPPLNLSHAEAAEAVTRLALACETVRAQVAQAA